MITGSPVTKHAYQDFIVAHGLADEVETLLLATLHCECARQAGNVAQEVSHHFAAARRQVDLRVELNSVQSLLFVGDRRNDVFRSSDRSESVGDLIDAIAVCEQHFFLCV